jgi:hypothetical protein
VAHFYRGKVLNVRAEYTFRGDLTWERLEESKSSRIAYRPLTGGASDEANWPASQEVLVDGLVRFEKALLPFVTSLK